MTDRSWITEGAEVAVCSGSMSRTVTFERVERLTKTLIVLADGRRFSGIDLRERAKPGHLPAFLADPKNPSVVEAFARQQLRAFVAAGERLIHGAGATVHTMTPEQVREALDNLDDQLNAARKEVDRRAGL